MKSYFHFLLVKVIKWLFKFEFAPLHQIIDSQSNSAYHYTSSNSIKFKNFDNEIMPIGLQKLLI